MKGAIIGFGVIAEGHLFAYNTIDELEIVAVLDISEARRNIAKSLIPGVRCYDSFDLLSENEVLDFVDVCTPPYCRFDYMMRSLKKGINVIGEKPFLFTTKEYDELLKISIKNRTILYPSHNYKYAPVVRMTKEIVNDASFGEIINGHYKTYRIGHALGNAQWNKDWRRDALYSGGGIIYDHGPHSIYMSCYFMNQWPTAVSCISCCSSDIYDTEDTAVLTLYFNNNVKIDIFLTWVSSVRETCYYIFGTKGSIQIEDDMIKQIDSDGREHVIRIESEFNDPQHKSWFKGVLRDFYESMENKEFRNDLLEESYITIATIEAAMLSSKLGGAKIELNLPSQFAN